MIMLWYIMITDAAVLKSAEFLVFVHLMHQQGHKVFLLSKQI